jgi:hypothetical protein
VRQLRRHPPSADGFDEGYRLDVEALDGFVPEACHQEIEISFMKWKNPNAAG